MPAFDLEINGPNTIQESERKGSAKSLFWPWAGLIVQQIILDICQEPFQVRLLWDGLCSAHQLSP